MDSRTYENWTVLEVTTSFQKFKYGIEIRIWSVGQDNSQSWVRISYGTIKYVVDSNQDDTEIPADPQEDQVSRTSIKVVAVRSKAKAKPQQREPVDTTITIPMHERRWIDIEPSEPNLAAYDLSKKVISLLRHNQTVQREKMEQLNSTELNFIFEIILHKYSIGLMSVGKLVWQQEEVQKEDISIALIIREESFTSELFKDTLETISLILRYRTMSYDHHREKDQVQEKNESQQIATNLLQRCRRKYHPRPQQVRGREVLEVKIPGVQLLRKRSHQVDLRVPGVRKLRNVTERGNPMSEATESLQAAGGLHDNTPGRKQAHLRSRPTKTPPKFHEKRGKKTQEDPQREKNNENGGGRRTKKREIVDLPLSGPPPHPSGPHRKMPKIDRGQRR